MNDRELLRHRVFEWKYPGKPEKGYVLSAGGQQIGRLWFEQWSSGSAIGETPAGSWKLVREGFLRQRYVISREDTGEEVAIYTQRWTATDGALQFRDGRRYLWSLKSLWSDEHMLRDDGGIVVFSLKKGVAPFRWSELFREQGTISMHGVVNDGKILSVLLCFAWWLILLQTEDASGAAAVVATMG